MKDLMKDLLEQFDEQNAKEKEDMHKLERAVHRKD